MKIAVYDPPMCCSTGVCGPSVDPELVRFAADLAWLERHDVEVERFNLAQQPAAFAETAAVKDALSKDGNACLPLLLGDGAVLCKSRYPTRQELAKFAGVEIQPSIFTDAVRELVAIGAAIGSNCEPCFKYHYNEARKLGVSKDDMRLAVEMAQAVKDSPAQSILQLAEKYLREQPAKAAACCCGSATDDSAPDAAPGKKSSCC
jgi:AhpD family alkylhydroperoxidase